MNRYWEQMTRMDSMNVGLDNNKKNYSKNNGLSFLISFELVEFERDQLETFKTNN